jgi:regulator of nucleoside diphosphate kinase
MISRAIFSKNQVVITGNDFDRLSELVRSPRYRVSHSALLADLRGELERGKVVPPLKVPPRVVTMNSRVKLRDLDSGESETYTLVYPSEANIDEEKLSVLAPLGTALLGTRAGQTVEVDAPGGLRRVKVERVLYQPEAAGDWHL